jgi:hypothetical protein
MVQITQIECFLKPTVDTITPHLSGTCPACEAFRGTVVELSRLVTLVAMGYRRGTFGLGSV